MPTDCFQFHQTFIYYSIEAKLFLTKMIRGINNSKTKTLGINDFVTTVPALNRHSDCLVRGRYQVSRKLFVSSRPTIEFSSFVVTTAWHNARRPRRRGAQQ